LEHAVQGFVLYRSPERQIDEIASPDLIGMLAGGVPQPPSYKAAHTRRLRRAQNAGLWNSAYDVAISNVGERETPAGSHRIECTEWYGVPAPWSAIFVSWCFARAGATACPLGGIAAPRAPPSHRFRDELPGPGQKVAPAHVRRARRSGARRHGAHPRAFARAKWWGG